jgi:hypothetical protein
MATKPNFIRGHLPVARSVASGENIATFDASSSVWPFRREGKWEIVARALLEHDELSGNAVKDIIEAASRRMEREDRLDRQRWIEAMADDKREPEPFMGPCQQASSREQQGVRRRGPWRGWSTRLYRPPMFPLAVLLEEMGRGKPFRGLPSPKCPDPVRPTFEPSTGLRRQIVGSHSPGD